VFKRKTKTALHQESLFKPIARDLKNDPKRIIAHLDMDAFFASAEERERPYLSGRPIVVGSDPSGGKGRGVVSTANYLARSYGIRSALPISKAWQLSQEAKRAGKPEAVFVGCNFFLYEKISSRIVEITQEMLQEFKADLRRPLIEIAGIDEFYLDLSFLGDYKKAERFGEKLQQRIKKQEKLTASIGLGPNKLIAKIASDFQKPNGLTVISPEKVDDFLKDLPISKIHGIGPKTNLIFKTQKVNTVGEAGRLPMDFYQKGFGKFGEDLYWRLKGIDSRPLERPTKAKSIGCHETLMEDTFELGKLLPKLEAMAVEIVGRMRRDGFKVFERGVLTVRFSDFVTKTRSKTFSQPISSKLELEKWATKILLTFLDKRENKTGQSIRLIGLRIEKMK